MENTIVQHFQIYICLFFLLVLSLSECILEEHGSPGVEVLVLSLVLRI